jgi:zinc protease
MSKKLTTKTQTKSPIGYDFVRKAGPVEEYRLKTNGLRVLYYNRPNTGVITTNITYLVGARDEARGETGLAHMLEHMIFKPTKADMKAGITSGRGMKFERETGAVLNANTWKDRTTYYFSYPTKYFTEALQIEAERMTGVVLTDEVLKPEQGNVLSEFDMYNGDPGFALSVAMVNTTFHSHPYGHETIGFREDIEDYTAEKLDKFYKNYYRPDNAVMMVIGDVNRETALKEVRNCFKDIENPAAEIPRFSIREPKQEGIRRVSIERPSTTNILSIGFKHAGFPSKDWFIANIMGYVLTSGQDSVLHRLLVDSGMASNVATMIEPTSETNMGSINVYLAPEYTHTEVESLIMKALEQLRAKDISGLVAKAKERAITGEIIDRDSSLSIAGDLTEYVAAGDWTVYTEALRLIDSISANDVITCMKQTFTTNNLTIGEFIGK